MVGRIPSLKMQISTTLILILQEIMVVCILNYALNLVGFFLRELGTQLLFETIQGGIAVYYSTTVVICILGLGNACPSGYPLAVVCDKQGQLLVELVPGVPIVRPLHWKFGLVLTTISVLGGSLMQLHLLEAH